MNKKGISPLVATVLIIGFTVALAAVIMVWGQDFITGMVERTENLEPLRLDNIDNTHSKILNSYMLNVTEKPPVIVFSCEEGSYKWVKEYYGNTDTVFLYPDNTTFHTSLEGLCNGFSRWAE